MNRDDASTSVLVFVLASSQFTRNFSCAYACVVHCTCEPASMLGWTDLSQIFGFFKCLPLRVLFCLFVCLFWLQLWNVPVLIILTCSCGGLFDWWNMIINSRHMVYSILLGLWRVSVYWPADLTKESFATTNSLCLQVKPKLQQRQPLLPVKKSVLLPTKLKVGQPFLGVDLRRNKTCLHWASRILRMRRTFALCLLIHLYMSFLQKERVCECKIMVANI